MNDDFNILLVEDNIINAFFLRSILEKKGFKINTAFSGIDAINKLKTNIDLTIINISEPVLLNPMDIADMILKIKNIPIIVMSDIEYKNINHDFYSNRIFLEKSKKGISNLVDLTFLYFKCKQRNKINLPGDLLHAC